MYLKGSKWTMQKRRQPMNYLRWAFWALLIAGVWYLGTIPDVVTQPFRPEPTATRDPESVLTEAEQAFTEGKFQNAIELYQSVIPARPGDATIYLSLARTQLFAGQYALARTNTENALLLSPNNALAHALRGAALTAQGETLIAESAIRRALELDPNNALAHAFYAELLATQYINGTGPLDVIDRMGEESRAAVGLGPGLLETQRARGLVLYATTNYPESVVAYQAAIAINPKIADLHLALGRSYRSLGVYDKAIESLTTATLLNPTDPTAPYLIARIYATVGENAKAEQYAEQAVQADPVDAFWRGTLGVMYYQNYKWPDAIRELQLTIRGGTLDDGTVIEPLELTGELRIVEYYFTYGLVLARQGRCGEALPIAVELQEKVPNDALAVYNASEINRICLESLGGATATPAPTP